MYNVEEYIERCIRTLEDQDIQTNDYEIICIDDGSPDDCSAIIKKLQDEFDNILLLIQENQGVSLARNNGIDKATGRFILFIDPDDYIDTYSLGRLLDNAETQKANVAFLGFTFLSESYEKVRNVFYDNLKSQVFTGIEAYSLSRGDGQTDPDRMWAVLIERDFLIQNKLRFLPNVPFLEDGELIARILCLADRCIFDGQSFYQRTTRPGSATNSSLFHSEQAVNGFLLAAGNLKYFQQNQSLSDYQKDFLNQPICKFVILAITSSKRRFRFNKVSYLKKRLKTLGLEKLNLTSVNSEYRLLGMMYNTSTYLLILYYFIMNAFKSLILKCRKILYSALAVGRNH